MTSFFERSFIWGRSDTTPCPFLVVNQLADNLVEPIWLDFVMFNLSRKDSSYQDVFMGHRKLKNSQKFDPAALSNFENVWFIHQYDPLQKKKQKQPVKNEALAHCSQTLGLQYELHGSML